MVGDKYHLEIPFWWWDANSNSFGNAIKTWKFFLWGELERRKLYYKDYDAYRYSENFID